MPTISPQNHDHNAPWWWKRLETTLIGVFTGLIPLTGLSTLLPENWKTEVSLVILPGLAMLTKFIGVMIRGEDQKPTQ